MQRSLAFPVISVTGEPLLSLYIVATMKRASAHVAALLILLLLAPTLAPAARQCASIGEHGCCGSESATALKAEVTVPPCCELKADHRPSAALKPSPRGTVGSPPLVSVALITPARMHDPLLVQVESVRYSPASRQALLSVFLI